jgi:hypothetical protein
VGYQASILDRHRLAAQRGIRGQGRLMSTGVCVFSPSYFALLAFDSRSQKSESTDGCYSKVTVLTVLYGVCPPVVEKR